MRWTQFEEKVNEIISKYKSSNERVEREDRDILEEIQKVFLLMIEKYFLIY